MKKVLSLLLTGLIIASNSGVVEVQAKDFSNNVKLVDTCYNDENIALSPISLNQALGMVANGAVSTTSKEITNYLGMSKAKYNKFSKSYKSGLTDEVKVANSVWLTNNSAYKLDSKFNKSLKVYYGVSCRRVAFGTDKGTQKINSWVKKNTGGMIPKLYKETSKTTRLSLVNAIYFESSWKNNFDGRDTYSGDFNDLDGSTSKADFMTAKSSSYLENSKALGVVRPYKNDRYEFVAVLPKSKGDFDLKDLDIDGLLNSVKKKEVEYHLPKFEIETTAKLKNTLINNFGFKTAFSDEARFDNILSSKQPLHIDDITQKVLVKVDELGTKAAAVTSIDMVDNAMVIEEPVKEIRFNRPFAFMIYDNKTETVLFLGKLVGNF